MYKSVEKKPFDKHLLAELHTDLLRHSKEIFETITEVLENWCGGTFTLYLYAHPSLQEELKKISRIYQFLKVYRNYKEVYPDKQNVLYDYSVYCAFTNEEGCFENHEILRSIASKRLLGNMLQVPEIETLLKEYTSLLICTYVFASSNSLADEESSYFAETLIRLEENAKNLNKERILIGVTLYKQNMSKLSKEQKSIEEYTPLVAETFMLQAKLTACYNYLCEREFVTTIIA